MKQIHLNGFTQNSPAPHSPGLWRHPEDEGTRHAVQVPLHDPLLPIAAMAQETSHLGFAPTYSATYTQPYKLARQFSTLDHLTKGRVGWNIVTSYLESEAVNQGLPTRIEHDTRYDRADEYMDVVYKLWERSWEDDAVVRDLARATYADPARVHPIGHKGKFFNVPGVHLVEPSIQRTPVLFQAGSSARGRDFAARHAEAIFTTTQNSIEELRVFARDIRGRARGFGRRPEDVLIIPGIVPVIGATEQDAARRYEELKSYVSFEGTLALLSGHTGVDLSGFDPDAYVTNVATNGSHGFLQQYALDPDRKWTVREAIQNHGLGIGAMKVVGTPEQIADRLQQMVFEGDVDGFNIIQAVSPGTLRDFVDHVVPILQQRGLFRTEYETGTLREHLFGKGHVRLPQRHPARQVTVPGAALEKAAPLLQAV